jgi:hypothetical protein
MFFGGISRQRMAQTSLHTWFFEKTKYAGSFDLTLGVGEIH